jgi:hypothetical protein
LPAAANMASVVILIIEKTMKKILKKKIISDLPTLIFSGYETGTTGIFFTPDARHKKMPKHIWAKYVTFACINK